MTQPRIYCALQFQPAVNGKHSYVAIYVAATSFDLAAQYLRQEQYLVGPGETFLLSDEAVQRGPVGRVVNGEERHDEPTIEEHQNWVRVMTRPSYEDGVRSGPTYIRVKH
jgi:hypothetical protein